MYGNCVESKTGTFIFEDLNDDGIASLERFRIEKDTIGIQVPNLKDINGKDVYTTDIVKIKCDSIDEFRKLRNIELTGEVVYDESLYGFYIKTTIGSIDGNAVEVLDIYDYDKDLEVIGNTIE